MTQRAANPEPGDARWRKPHIYSVPESRDIKAPIPHGGLGESAWYHGRLAWVKKLRQPYQIDFRKVLGTENPADLFTKIQASPAFQECEDSLLSKMK